MPVNDQLDIVLDSVQKTTILDAVATIRATLIAAIGSPLNLSTTERKETPSVDNYREPFVNKAVVVLGPTYTNLHGADVTLTRATNCWNFRKDGKEIEIAIDDVRDILGDALINSENVSLRFTDDFRESAQRNKDKNVLGADVVWNELKDLYKRENNPPAEPPV